MRRVFQSQVAAPVLVAALIFSASTASAQGVEQWMLEDRTSSPARVQSSPTESRGTQPEDAHDQDHGNVMLLHTASVLQWICRDPEVSAALGSDTSSCYTRMWSSAKECEKQLVGAAPNKASAEIDGRNAILDFRAAYRSCISANFSQKELDRGRPAPAFSDNPKDPLEDRMISKWGGRDNG